MMFMRSFTFSRIFGSNGTLFIVVLRCVMEAFGLHRFLDACGAHTPIDLVLVKDTAACRTNGSTAAEFTQIGVRKLQLRRLLSHIQSFRNTSG